jgi:hypothetical protein
MRCLWRSHPLTGEQRQLGVPGMPAIAACGCSTFNLGVIVTSGHTPGREVLDLHRRPAPVGVACDLVAPSLIPKGGQSTTTFIRGKAPITARRGGRPIAQSLLDVLLRDL